MQSAIHHNIVRTLYNFSFVIFHRMVKLLSIYYQFTINYLNYNVEREYVIEKVHGRYKTIIPPSNE